MNKKCMGTLLIISLLGLEACYAVDLSPQIVNYEVKRASLTKNDLKNQYTIALDKFMQSNVRASYQDFKLIIDNVCPNDYIYLQLSKKMASIGFFNLAELAMSKINDDEISGLMEEDVKKYYFPAYKHTHKDQMYLAEIFSNIMYNEQSKEATSELKKHISLLTESDYANYLVAFGSMKSGDVEGAKKSIETAIEKNPQNINYKRLRTEILSQSKNNKEGLKALKELMLEDINTIIFDDEIETSKHYILYKTAKNDYWKKLYLAYYYYGEKEFAKALRVLQTAISGKKNINKEVFALTARVYFEMKEFEKAQDYAMKALDIDKDNILALNVLGDIALRDKNYKDAEKKYKKANSKDTSYKSTIKLAKTYQQQNESKKAKDLYAKVLKTSSKSYEAYYEMALMDKDRQVAYLKKTVAINPNYSQAWIDLARIEIENEDYDKASTYLNVVKFLGENDYRYFYYLGLVQKNKGLTEEANKNFQKSINLNPNNELINEELSI